MSRGVPSGSEPPAQCAAAFERRAARAQALAGESVAAREALEFAAGLYRIQGALAEAALRAHRTRPLSGHVEPDLAELAAPLADALRFAAAHGPPALGEEAAARAGEDPRARLSAWWNDDGSGRDDYLSRAMLRPYAEVLAALGIRPQRPAASGGCPFCGAPPWIACRRGSGESEGAQRFLACALCGGEWAVGRVRCPACGEETPDKLPSFQSDRYPAVRIETCATCHIYVKSIDLTVDARAIPEVDDLLSLAMDLWAGQEGYTRIEPGLAGI